jgi:hypothetical protein
MKATLEFSLPEDQAEFEDYQKGRDLLYLMQQWIQEAKWKVEDGKMSGDELLEDLKKAIENENITLL